MALKTKLEVYACIDIDGQVYDIETIIRCINIYINAKQQQYELTKLEHVVLDVQRDTKDIIERGLHSLCQMFKQLKLKTNNEVWFLYMSIGDLKNLQDNVTLVVLNKNPSVRECSYSINKNKLDILKENNKNDKLNGVKLLTKTLDELMMTKKKIRYKQQN